MANRLSLEALLVLQAIVQKDGLSRLFVQPVHATELRPISHAINAFGIETSNAVSDGKNSIAAMGRLAFWHQMVDDAVKREAAVIRHPVAIALHQHLNENDQMRKLAKRILKAREKWAMNPSFAQLEDMEEHAESTASSLLLMQLAIVEREGEECLRRCSRPSWNGRWHMQMDHGRPQEYREGEGDGHTKGSIGKTLAEH